MTGNHATRRNFLFGAAAAVTLAAPGYTAASADKAADWNRVVTLAKAAFDLKAKPLAGAGPVRKRQIDAIAAAFTRAATAHHAYLMNHVNTRDPATGPRAKGYFVLGLYHEYAFDYWSANHWYQKAARDVSYLKRRGLSVPQYETSRSAASIGDLLPARLQLTTQRMKVTPRSEAPRAKVRRMSVVIPKGPGETLTVLDELAALGITPAPGFYTVTLVAPLDEAAIAPPE